MKTTPSGSTAATAIALTPPQVATTSALSAAARRIEPRSLACTRGSSTHGASAIGQTSTETPPSSVVMRGRQHERERRQDLGAGRAEVELAGQPQDPEERHAEQQRPPQPLHHPRRQPDQLAEDEERPHRPRVAVGLVLQLAERRRGVPQPQARLARNRRGAGDQVELGVGDHLARRLRERERGEDRGVPGLAQRRGRQRPRRPRTPRRRSAGARLGAHSGRAPR